VNKTNAWKKLTDARDADNNRIVSHGASVPSAVAGYAKGCIFIDTTNGVLYHNEGSATSCTFTAVGAVADLPVANTYMIVGNGSGVGAAVAISGHISIANTGAVTLKTHNVTAAAAAPDVADLLVISDESASGDPTLAFTVQELFNAMNGLTDAAPVITAAATDKIPLVDKTDNAAKTVTLFEILTAAVGTGLAQDGTSGALTVTGMVGLNATASELNSAADQSANTEDISGAGALTPGTRVSQIAGGTGFAVTLAAPTAAEVGKLKIITLESISSSAVTMALTEVIGGTAGTSASFDAAGETLVLVGVESAPASFKWLVLKEHGVTLS